MRRRLAVVLLAVALPAHAGRDCEERPATTESIQRALALATELQEKLDESGASFAFIGRSGQDLTRYKLRYSHMGFAWRDHPKGRWTVVHQLNHCGTARSDIYDEGLATFFLDDLWKMQAVVLVPGDAMQARIARTLADGAHLALHEPRYSMVAYPFAGRYQNSNQWLLEVVAAAESRDLTVRTRAEAQQWLRLARYAPTELRLDTLTRLGARLTKANIAFDDHPGEHRWSDRIQTATVDSALAWLTAREPGARRFTVGEE